MTDLELRNYLKQYFPQENSRCEWKEFKNLKNALLGNEKDDVISYVSAIANMSGGSLVLGVVDKTLEITGINPYSYTAQSATLIIKEHCTNLSTEGLSIDEYITSDTNKCVWIINIPKHLPKLPVYAHRKAWQRIEDSLVEMLPERLNAILSEMELPDDWSAGIIEEATIDDLETEGGGIKKLFEKQRQRLFPMPDYDLSKSMVRVEVIGKVINETFAQILTENPTLSLNDIMLLDKVQKHQLLTEEEIRLLRKRNLIEGRKPNFYLSAVTVAPLETTNLKQQYIQNSSFDDNYFRDLIVKYITKFKHANRETIEGLLLDKLSSVLKEQQKKDKVTNLLSSLKRKDIICYDKDNKYWVLVKKKK